MSPSNVVLFLVGFAIGTVATMIFFVAVISRVIPLTLDRGMREFRRLVSDAAVR